jgi:hypothetical protein
MEGLNLEPKPSKLFNRLQLRCLITVWRDIFPIFSQVFLKMLLANFMVLKQKQNKKNKKRPFMKMNHEDQLLSKKVHFHRNGFVIKRQRLIYTTIKNFFLISQKDFIKKRKAPQKYIGYIQKEHLTRKRKAGKKIRIAKSQRGKISRSP